MSSEVISPSKILYSRDFLLRYATLQKEEPTIAEKLLPVLNTPPVQATKPAKRVPKNPVEVTPNTSTTTSYRPTAKTPNLRKSGNMPVFSQKENIPNQTPSKPGVESFTTPVRKGALAPRPARPAVNKSPNARKTWVAAVESNGMLSGSSHPLDHSSEPYQPIGVQVVVSQPLPTPDQKAFNTPISSPNPKTPLSRAMDTRDKFNEPASPVSGTSTSDAHFLSPKSAGSTPFKSPMSPGGTRYSPSKSPRSPVRPISPLDEKGVVNVVGMVNLRNGDVTYISGILIMLTPLKLY
jgi:hypothetical protein